MFHTIPEKFLSTAFCESLWHVQKTMKKMDRINSRPCRSTSIAQVPQTYLHNKSLSAFDNPLNVIEIAFIHKCIPQTFVVISGIFGGQMDL